MKVRNNTVVLCCGSKKCPELKIVDNQVVIKDDDGKTIKISKEQATLIPEAIKALDK